jgi:TatD DNase family protein
MTAPSLIDTHCHLDAAEFSAFAADRADVVARALAAGVSTIVVPAVSAAGFAGVRACADAYACVRPAYGIHPLYVGAAVDGDLVLLRERIAREIENERGPVAIGEIGLDFFVPGADVARQTHFFVEQLKIARDFGLPVLLHVRRAQDAVLADWRRVHQRRGRGGSAESAGIAHAFNGSRQQADAFIAEGFRLGFGGVMTDPRARRIRELAATLPLPAIVLETDSPDLPPVFARGLRNEPAYLPRIAQTLAELRGISLAALAQASSANARAVMPRLAAASGQLPA